MAIDSSEPAAEEAINTLRDAVVPQAFREAPAEVLVSGVAAFNADFNAMMGDYLPLVFAFVLGLSFLLLLLAFRSVVVPLKAIVMTCCPSARPTACWSWSSRRATARTSSASRRPRRSVPGCRSSSLDPLR
jgi:RND superfamily putative drug exporter